MQKSNCDDRGAERDERARKKDGAQTGPAGDESKRRARQPERQIEKRGVDAHGEAAAFHGRAADRFDTETRIDERITKTGERSASKRHAGPWREPDQRLTDRFDQDADERDPGATDLVGQMAEKEAAG